MHENPEERKKIEAALNTSLNTIKRYENEFSMLSDEFIKKFLQNAIPETEDTFQWWAELKIARELQEKLNLTNSTR